MEFVLIAIVILVVALIAGLGLLVGRGRRTTRLDDDAVAGTTLTRPRPPAPAQEAPPSGSTASGLGLPPVPGQGGEPLAQRCAVRRNCAPVEPSAIRASDDPYPRTIAPRTAPHLKSGADLSRAHGGADPTLVAADDASSVL